MSEPLTRRLQQHARERGELCAYRFLADEEVIRELTFHELGARVERLGRQLEQRVCADGRVLLALPWDGPFAVGLLGAFAAGRAVAGIPVYPEDRGALVDRVDTLLEQLSPTLLVTTADLAEGLKSSVAKRSVGLALLDAHGLQVPEEGSAGPVAPSNAAGRDSNAGTALIQFTSGSTGGSRGVCLTADNVWSTLEDIDASFEHGPESVLVSWLPMSHDMGLIYGLLQPIHVGCTGVLSEPRSFARDSLSWLRTIERYGGTHSAAPNFAYELCVRAAREGSGEALDLSSWRVALNAAETVRAATLERFARSFASSGFQRRNFSPGYGLAEATAKVTAVARGEEPALVELDGETYVSCGRVGEGMQLRVVDPESREPLPTGEVGELWVRGANVAQGYLRSPLAASGARADFEGRTADGEGPWLRTRDLGFLDEGGALYFCGRLDDRLKVRGKTVYPESLEAAIEERVPGLRRGRGAAVALSVDGQERLVLVYEVRRSAEDRALDLLQPLRSAALEASGVAPFGLLLVRAGSVPVTTSGKVSRKGVRSKLIAGEFDPLGVDLPLDSIQLAELSSIEEAPGGRPAPGASRGAGAGSGAVVVLGAACRFPGARDLGEFAALLDGDEVGFSARPPTGRLENPVRATPGDLRRWGWLEGVERFDAAFFGISHREARLMDPQQRHLLELSWHALQHAGIEPRSMSGASVGVFVGLATQDYQRLVLERGTRLDAQAALGTSNGVAAARISHALNLKGPSFSVDAACASSLMALHQARLSLLRGECEVALVGGANLILHDAWNAAFTRAGMISPSGRSRPFDRGADGYVRAEGAAVVVLSRSDWAGPVEAGPLGVRPLAELSGSWASHDGRAGGLTAPNPKAQADVLGAAWRDAGVAPGRIGLVEAHGTGTSLGDPAELAALNALMRERSAAEGPCRVSSIKARIGHTEAAAGLAGLLSALAAVVDGRLPGMPTLTDPLEYDAERLDCTSDASPWNAPVEQRIAGVSAFGFGGANVHAVLRGVESGRAFAEPRLPLQPFAGEVHWLERRSTPDPARVQRGHPVLEAIARVCLADADQLDEEQRLFDDLGFDSLMIVELTRTLRELAPGLEDREQLITAESTVGELLALVDRATREPRPIPAANSAAKPAAPSAGGTEAEGAWDTYAELIGVDPSSSYVVAGVREEQRQVHSLRGDGREFSGRLNVENKYAGSSDFHLSQMSCYAFLAQMIQGYLCYKFDRTKDGFGMPRLTSIEMRWSRMIRTSQGVPGRLTEVSSRLEDGLELVEVSFDVGEGAATGRIVGTVPVLDGAEPVAHRVPRDYADLASLYGIDPASTYTGGGFREEVLTLRDLRKSGRALSGALDVDNAFSDSPSFHLSQRSAYSAIVQMVLGYLCAEFGCTRADLGMPVLQEFRLDWREMVPFPAGIPMRVEVLDTADLGARARMRFAVDVGHDHGRGEILGLFEKPQVSGDSSTQSPLTVDASSAS